MQATRRVVSFGILAFLAGCGGGSGPQTVARAPDPAMRPVPNAGFDAWVAGFRGRALAQGVRPATFDAAFAQAGFLPGVIERDRNQTEFTRTLEDYLAIAASDERVGKGRAALARHGGTLNAIAARYAVEPEVVTAVWGMESYYGERRGDVPVVSALATLAYEGRRGSFFESQLIAALKILQNGDVSAVGDDRQLGRGDGAYAVHPDLVPRLCGGLHRRRAARHLGGRSDRRAGLGGGLPVAVGLAARPAVGRRGAAARRVLRPGRAWIDAERVGLGGGGGARHGRAGGAGPWCRRRSSRRWGGPARRS